MIRVFDTETTGFHPPEAAVCEVGWTDIYQAEPGETPGWHVEGWQSRLVHPGHPIPVEVMAIHHITNEDVADAPSFAMIAHELREGDPVAYCAHNFAFDGQWYDPPGDQICTYRCAIKLDPKSPKHSNQYLRYRYKLPVDRDVATPQHRAGPDSYVTAHLLARMLTKHSVQELVAITKEPLIQPRLHFGKHAGADIEDVPTDYLQWMTRQTDMDADAKRTAAHHLTLRQTDGAKP